MNVLTHEERLKAMKRCVFNRHKRNLNNLGEIEGKVLSLMQSAFHTFKHYT